MPDGYWWICPECGYRERMRTLSGDPRCPKHYAGTWRAMPIMRPEREPCRCGAYCWRIGGEAGCSFVGDSLAGGPGA
jgi:hypothetical protein